MINSVSTNPCFTPPLQKDPSADLNQAQDALNSMQVYLAANNLKAMQTEANNIRCAGADYAADTNQSEAGQAFCTDMNDLSVTILNTIESKDLKALPVLFDQVQTRITQER